MQMNKKAHRWLGLQNGLFYVLLLALLGLIGFASTQWTWTADWTATNRNTLSTPTQSLLRTLDKPLKFVFYIPDDSGLQAQIQKLVSKYQRVKADTSVEFVNPDLDPQRAKQDGIRYAGQVLLQVGDRREIVESVTETSLLQALQRMSRDGERLVIFLEGHGERDPLATQTNGLSQLVDQLEKKGFKVQPHHLVRTQNIPDNASFVVIAAPQQDLLAGEVAILKQYVEQGGNLLWLQDPGSLHGLQPLENVLGLKIYSGTVIDANQDLQAMLGINHPAVVPVVDYSDSDITTSLQGAQTLFPFATEVTRDPQASPQTGALVWDMQDLLTTLPASWLETSGVLEGNVKFDENSDDQPGPLTIGMALTRTLAAPSDKANAPARQQRVVVIGDSDFLLNSFIGQVANLDLATNVFNWLSEDDKLLSVPANPAHDTQINLDKISAFVMAGFFLVLLPLGLIAAGSVIWWRRRKR